MKNYEVRAYENENCFDYVKIQAQNIHEAAEKSGFINCKVSVLGTDMDCGTYKLNEKGKVVYEYKGE